MNEQGAQPEEAERRRRASWISLGFEQLVHHIARGETGSAQRPFDVLIVGSGYGGAVAAAELAGCREGDRPITVCVLERGQEYVEGAFPSSVDDLAGHVRFSSGQFPHARGNLDALFDVRLGEDINVLLANGLGGGSLINAGVMLEPGKDVLKRAFPDVKEDVWPSLFREARYLLGASLSKLQPEIPNQYDRDAAPPKAQALRRFSPSEDRFKTVPITVAIDARLTSANVQLDACIGCGDCFTGCNYNAKDSLDVNLLVTAASRGASLYTGATALKLFQWRKLWVVETVPTSAAARARHGPPTLVHARRVILAAGTLGSTELLLKSQGKDLPFSAKLGKGFSSNGEMIAVMRGHDAEANAAARETVPPEERGIGPTITAAIDLRTDPKRPYMIQEMGIPAALRRLFEEVTSTASTFQSLAKFDLKIHGFEPRRRLDPCAVDANKMKHSTVIAMMGDDGAEGAIELRKGEPSCGDGEVAIAWKQLRALDAKCGSINDRQMEVLEGLKRRGGRRTEVLPNPVWRLLPKGMEFLFDSARGPNVTVHPLGGCTMGSDAAKGVVDGFGRVYDPRLAPDGVYDGLVVLDGSVIPQALSCNPSLTITAVALRAARGLRAAWRLTAPGAAQEPPVVQRPALEKSVRPAVKAGALFELRERLVGTAWVPIPGNTSQRAWRYVEITLAYRPFSLLRLMRRLRRDVRVKEKESTLRIFPSEKAYKDALRPTDDSKTVEQRLQELALCSVPVKGRLFVLHRGFSWPVGRIVRGVVAWYLNRGWRDIYHWITGTGTTPMDVTAIPRMAWSLVRFASRAGEIRRFEYKLVAKVGAEEIRVEGRKRLTYSIDCNLWEQLERVRLTRFGSGLVMGHLEVDMDYFAAQRTPLMRLFSQPNMPASLIDFGAFGMYVARVMVGIHAWSFRRPDPRPPGPVRPLPEEIHRNVLERFWMGCKIALTDSPRAGWNVLRHPMPAPYLVELPMGEAHGSAVHIRLTRFERPSTDARPPVLMIHGYGASGTTFAHAAVQPGLAEYLCAQGRDVWILDMRTSCGMPTSKLPWTFEDEAFGDIPVAVAHILEHTGRGQVDVVAHCMGAAMLSIAVLAEPHRGDPYYVERMRLPLSIRGAVLSQVGPLMQFRPLNVLRAYVMRYLRYYLGMDSFDFRVPDEPKLAPQLMDRFFSTLRYPPAERAFENRGRLDNSFSGTRRRLDSLYGHSFSLLNVNGKVLDRIDDFFGPVHLRTVAQTLHFALSHRVTDSAGRASYLTRESRDRRWSFDTLTLHAADNGVMDVATGNWIKNYFRNKTEWVDLPPGSSPVRTDEYPGAGHQDSLIGKTRVTGPIFGKIRRFLEEEHGVRVPSPNWNWDPHPPWAGPVWGPPALDAYRFGLSGDPSLGIPDFALCIPVRAVRDPQDPRKTRYEPRCIFGTLQPGLPSSVFLAAVNADENGWHRIVLGKHFLDANRVNGVLILHCYDHTASGVRAATASEEVKPLGDLNRRKISAILGGRVIEATLWSSTGNAQLDKLLKELNEPEPLEDRVRKLLSDPRSLDLDEAFIPAPVDDGRLPVRIFAGSCQYPQGILDELIAWRGYERMGALLRGYRAHKALAAEKSVLLLVGDQVYADSTAGLFDPTMADDMYRQPYQDLFSEPRVKKVTRALPAAMMLDDHELCDNWEPAGQGPLPRRQREARARGVAAYKAFQRTGNPVPQPPAVGRDELWFTFSVGDIPTFVCDTRADRQPRRRGRFERWSIMGQTQLDDLLQWLRDPIREHPGVPRIVAGPAMLLPRRLHAMRALFGDPLPDIDAPGVLDSDSWQGYPASLRAVLAAIAEERIENVIFVSGDDHVFGDAIIRVRRAGSERATRIHSIHASALYAPYPFANARPVDFRCEDSFRFAHGDQQYECEVKAVFHPQITSGFVQLVACPRGDRWKVTARFTGGDRRLVLRPLEMEAPAPAAAPVVAEIGGP